MRQALRRTVSAAVLSGLLLAGCSTPVVGTGSPAAGSRTDVTAEQFPVTGAVDGELDQLARNALADLDTFWRQAYPEFFGAGFEPLAGYFSVDSDDLDESTYPDTGIGCRRSPTDPEEVTGNAFYDPNCDVIAYDRALLQFLSDEYGRFLGPVVMAHEMGHAMQGRFGFAESGRSILDETQADCLAGAWTRWVADGHGEHVSVRVPELDGVVRGFLLLRDEVGSDPDDTSAHGSYFDRVSAFYAGFEEGVAACRDEFGEERLFTAQEFTAEDTNQGDAGYAEIVEWTEATLPEFWDTVFRGGFGTAFEPPAVQGFDGTAPDCGDMGAEDRDLGWCAADGTVYYDETELTRPAHGEIGDFAVATAVSLPYALAARAQAGLSTDDGAATRSAVCLTGWYAAQWFNGAFADSAGVAISPGDVDESVQFLLAHGVDDDVFPDVDASGFELVDAFRAGFLDGGIACDVGF